MLIVKFPPTRRGKPAEYVPPGPVPPSGPVLTAAVFQPYEGATVTLTFAQPINVEAYDAAAISVTLTGPQEPTYFDGSGVVSVISDTVVVLALVVTEGPPPDWGEVTLTVATNSGIVSANDATAWAGVSDLSLPFGQ